MLLKLDLRMLLYNDIEMKFGEIVENYKPINLVSIDLHMTSSFCHNDVITLESLGFYWSKVEKFKDVSDLKSDR